MEQITPIQTFIAGSRKPLLVIVGPTASGKTGYSIDLAQKLGSPAEVINADSRQLYKYLDIGTAKITTAEMQGVPHHLLDVLDPTEPVSVGWYKREALKVIDDCHQRNVIPLLVGGSMLYVSAVIDNLTLPSVHDEAIRKSLTDDLQQQGAAALYERLQVIDPKAAKSIHPHNTQHLIRALEFYEKEGRTKTDVLYNAKEPLLYDTYCFGIRRERADLVSRIEQRLVQMFTQGWIEEVEDLLARGYTADDPGMMSHGYREIIAYIESGKPDNLVELSESIAQKTRAFAKRQMTWWKPDERIQWIDY